ncbi:hypothetical protein GGR56DRAFT_235015 [Xylariaceae sp. FL0804]|nr:hypothetical protein GGR56DRAFT_235015 [Xylariaceae sp. FL0804]
MRFLCLHGMGTSGAIFKAQTSAFRAKLPAGAHSFDFVDAPHRLSDGGDGAGAGTGIMRSAVAGLFPGPHYTFCRDYTMAEVAAAPRGVLARLEAAAAAGAPYDALLCFSQGCAVAAGLLMALQVEHAQTVATMEREEREREEQEDQEDQEEGHINSASEGGEEQRPKKKRKKNKNKKQQEYPKLRLPVRGVVFICGGVPLPLLEVWGLRVPARAWDINAATGEDLQRKASRAGAEIAALVGGGGGGGGQDDNRNNNNNSRNNGINGTNGINGNNGNNKNKNSLDTMLQRYRARLGAGGGLWADTSTLHHQRELARACAAEGLQDNGGGPGQQQQHGRSSSSGGGGGGDEYGQHEHEHEYAYRYDPRALPPLPADDVYGLDLSGPALPRELVLRLPTVHVFGVRDPRYPAAVQLARLCGSGTTPDDGDPRWCGRRVFDTGGGHEIPRNARVSAEIADAIGWLQERVDRCVEEEEREEREREREEQRERERDEDEEENENVGDGDHEDGRGRVV